MTQTWQLQDAKNQLSEVVDRAVAGEPQIITRRGAEVAVVVAADEYRRLTRPAQNVVDFFRASPLVGVDLNLDRDRSAGRDVSL